ncbi:hypothetical protein K2Z84_15615 [Candidatus Binatia bacterium]|nr:hypothetical protein [Candidatus Binatia bacterium]
MQKIEAVIGCETMEQVTGALVASGAGSMTVAAVAGLPAAGRELSYRGVAYRARDVRLKLELLVPDREAAAVADLIRGACTTDPRARIWVGGVAEPATIAAVRRYDIAV